MLCPGISAWESIVLLHLTQQYQNKHEGAAIFVQGCFCSVQRVEVMKSSIHVALTWIAWWMSLKIMTSRAIISPEVFIREKLFWMMLLREKFRIKIMQKLRKHCINNAFPLFSRPTFLQLDMLQTWRNDKSLRIFRKRNRKNPKVFNTWNLYGSNQLS